MTHEEVRVQRGKIEAAASFVDELHAIRVGIVVQLLIEPLDGLLDWGFADGHESLLVRFVALPTLCRERL
jgi:hypothetical protein